MNLVVLLKNVSPSSVLYHAGYHSPVQAFTLTRAVETAQLLCSTSSTALVPSFGMKSSNGSKCHSFCLKIQELCMLRRSPRHVIQPHPWILYLTTLPTLSLFSLLCLGLAIIFSHGSICTLPPHSLQLSSPDRHINGIFSYIMDCAQKIPYQTNHKNNQSFPHSWYLF